MTAVARPPRSMAGAHAAPRTVAPAASAGSAEEEYVGRHRRDDRARHRHAAAATLAFLLAWIPAASAGRGRHRTG